MKSNQIISNLIWLPIIVLFVITGYTISQNAPSSFLIQTEFFLLFTSVIIVLNYLLQKNTFNLKKITKSISIIFSLALILFSALSFYNVISFIHTWNLLIGALLLFLGFTTLNILGWSNEKQSLINKILFLITLVVYGFLAFLFFLKVNTVTLKPYIIISLTLALIMFILGLILKQKS